MPYVIRIVHLFFDPVVDIIEIYFSCELVKTKRMPKINPMLDYVDKMIDQAGLTDLPEDVRKNYRVKLAEEATKRIGIMAMRELNESNVAAFTQLVEKNPSDFDAIMDFFSKNIPEFEQKMSSALADFANEFIEGSRNLGGEESA